jgi:hypothetical protein
MGYTGSLGTLGGRSALRIMRFEAVQKNESFYLIKKIIIIIKKKSLKNYSIYGFCYKITN